MAHEIPEYMSPNYVKDKTSVDILWRQLETLQSIAKEFGISNIFQDNGAEILQQLIYLNMKAVPGREGNDGVDINGCEWEMKSLDISKGNAGITTNHHLNHAIIKKYKSISRFCLTFASPCSRSVMISSAPAAFNSRSRCKKM